MQNTRMKKCGPDEWETLQRISLQTFSDSFRHLNEPGNFNDYVAKAFSGSQIKKELQNRDSHFYFFYENNELAGYLKLNERAAQTEPQGDDALEIERIYLYKKHQGKGYGKNMVEFAIGVAKELGKSKLWLGVWEENRSAIAFYKKMGFVEFGRHIFTIGTDKQTDLMMELSVF